MPVRLMQMSLSGGALILAVAIVRAAALDRLPKDTFRVLWYVALARLLLPVSIPLPAGFRAPVPALERLEAGVLAGRSGTASPGVAAVSWAAPVWALGAAALAAYFLVSWYRCRREFRTALPVRNELAERWLREHPLRRQVEIRQLTGLSTPLTYGVLRPVILLPRDTDWNDGKQANYVLCHEWVHIRRFDAAAKGIAAAALCVHWFNPLVWALYVLLDRDLELACDERVIRDLGGEDRRDYAMALIRMEERRSGFAPFSSCFSKNATEERITSIMKYKKASIVSLVLALVLILGATTAFAAAGDPIEGDTQFWTEDGQAVEGGEIIVPERKTDGEDGTFVPDPSSDGLTVDHSGARDMLEAGLSGSGFDLEEAVEAIESGAVPPLSPDNLPEGYSVNDQFTFTTEDGASYVVDMTYFPLTEG